MRVLAALALILPLHANAGDLIGGTNTYMMTSRDWKTGDFAGYYIYDSAGATEWNAGPLEDGPVECHGAGFWTPAEITGEGICIFGAPPNQWTVAHQMPPGSNPWGAQDKNRFHRQGIWRVLHGTGKFVGITGSGTFVSNQLADGRKTTWFEGEVEFAN
jgi:hypothetical protein